MWKAMGRKPSYFDSALTSTFAWCFTIFIILLGSFFICWAFFLEWGTAEKEGLFHTCFKQCCSPNLSMLLLQLWCQSGAVCPRFSLWPGLCTVIMPTCPVISHLMRWQQHKELQKSILSLLQGFHIPREKSTPFWGSRICGYEKTDGSFWHILIKALIKFFFCFDAPCSELKVFMQISPRHEGFGPSVDLSEQWVKQGKILLFFSKFWIKSQWKLTFWASLLMWILLLLPFCQWSQMLSAWRKLPGGQGSGCNLYPPVRSCSGAWEGAKLEILLN